MLLNEMFSVKYPVIQGAMANIATAEFAAAVSNAGGIGVIGTGAMNVEQAREAIHQMRIRDRFLRRTNTCWNRSKKCW